MVERLGGPRFRRDEDRLTAGAFDGLPGCSELDLLELDAFVGDQKYHAPTVEKSC